MKGTLSLSFHETIATQLRRPWKKFRDGTLYYGLSKTGTKRLRLTTKQGNKTYYKGTRSSGVGSHTKFGGYLINWDKVRTFVIPQNWNKNLSPLLSKELPTFKNTFSGYSGPTDPKLYLKKLNEFIVYGNEETEDHQMTSKNVERG